MKKEYLAIIVGILTIMGIVGCISFATVDIENPALFNIILIGIGGVAAVLTGCIAGRDYSPLPNWVFKPVTIIGGVMLIICSFIL
jgi:hypothetical protein